MNTAEDLPPLICAGCGLRRWNDQSVQWIETGPFATEREPFCIENGCADQQYRIVARLHTGTGWPQ